MSSVLKYNRNLSPMEFENNARKLMLYTIQRCGHFPKRYTFYLGVHLAKDAREMYSYIKRANAKEPTTLAEAKIRRANFMQAISLLWSMVGQIEIVKDLFRISDNVMEEWMGMIDFELELLNGVMRTDANHMARLM